MRCITTDDGSLLTTTVGGSSGCRDRKSATNAEQSCQLRSSQRPVAVGRRVVGINFWMKHRTIRNEAEGRGCVASQRDTER